MIDQSNRAGKDFNGYFIHHHLVKIDVTWNWSDNKRPLYESALYILLLSHSLFRRDPSVNKICIVFSRTVWCSGSLSYQNQFVRGSKRQFAHILIL